MWAHPITLGVLSIAMAWGADVVASRWSGAPRFPIPVAPVIVGIVAASLANALSPWAVVMVLAIYATLRFKEAAEHRRDALALSQEAAAGPAGQGGGSSGLPPAP